jgi:hypothetical protein
VNGPDLSAIGLKSTVRELELVLENPTSQMGIPYGKNIQSTENTRGFRILREVVTLTLSRDFRAA